MLLAFQRRKILIKRLALILSILCLFSACSNAILPQKETITIALPYEGNALRDADMEYMSWIADETSVNLEFIIIPPSQTQQYVELLMTNDYNSVDIVFFTMENTIDAKILENWDNVLVLNDLIETNSTFFKEFVDNYEKIDIIDAIISPEDEILYIPSLYDVYTGEISQTMWINVNHLTSLSMEIPKTVEDFYTVLKAFKELNPNIIPIISSIEDESFWAVNFLMNAFTICDSENKYLATENNKVYYPPATDAWRDGLIYLNNLYNENLLVLENFTYNNNEFIDICNDPQNLVGTFASSEVSKVLSENSPSLISYFLAMQPLSSSNYEATAITKPADIYVGGIIMKDSDNVEKSFEILDLMCSEEAFLLGNYGVEGVDYTYSQVWDISAIGTTAVITVTAENNLERSSEHYIALGPNLVRSEYANNVAWKGYQVNQNDYLDARAYKVYEPYFLYLEPIKTNNLDVKLDKLATYTKNSMVEFITGEKDVNDNEQWLEYLKGLEDLSLSEVLDNINS